MENIVGLKELRQNMANYAIKVKKGQSFIVVKQSKPLFKIIPLEADLQSQESVRQENIENARLSEFLQTGAQDAHQSLAPLSKEEHNYYLNL